MMRASAFVAVVAALSLACATGKPKPGVLAKVDVASKTCALQDGAEGEYVPPRVLQSGEMPRLAEPLPEGAPAPMGQYDCLITVDGGVARCRIARSVPGSDELVLSALWTWTFAPATCAGRPVAVSSMLSLEPMWIPRCNDTVPPSKAVKAGDPCHTDDGRAGTIEAPSQISGAPPRYTRVALERSEEGLAVVQCAITREGDLVHCRFVCSDTPTMEGGIIDALKTWKMTAVTCGGVPIQATYDIPVRMKLLQ